MKSIRKYLITLGIGFAVAFIIANSKNVFAQTDLATVFHILTDSFRIPAVMITGFGGLLFVSNEGGFDGLSYGMMTFFDLFRKHKKNIYSSFFEYKEAKVGKEMQFGFMVICGLVFVALTVITYLLYRKFI